MAIQLKHHHTSSLNVHLPPPFSVVPPPRSAAVRVHAVLGGRAQELIQSGAVTPIVPKDAASAMESQGYKLLDIRPEWEREKARVSGSLHVPLFVEDKDNSPVTLLKKWVHFGYIGLWTGQYFTMFNPHFLEQVEELVPDKESKLLVACGEGLRASNSIYGEAQSSSKIGVPSMAELRAPLLDGVSRSVMAVKKLEQGGYKNLGWLAGGFNRANEGDFPKVEGTEELQYATIGGASYYFLQLLILFKAVGNKS